MNSFSKLPGQKQTNTIKTKRESSPLGAMIQRQSEGLVFYKQFKMKSHFSA